MLMRADVLEAPAREARARLRLVRRLPSEPPLVTMRTCARCGEYAAFVRDADAGCWYTCVACGRYA